MPIPPIVPPTGEPNVTSTITLDQDYSVAAGETRYASGLSRMFVNYGFGLINPDLTNAGTIYAVGAGGMQLLYAQNFGTITNSGTMAVRSTDSTADGLTMISHFEGLINSGSLYAIGVTNARTLIDSSGSDIVNSGIIAAQANLHSSAILRSNGGSLVNTASGQILSESQDAVAVYLGRGHLNPPGWADRPDIDNAGLIQATSTGSGASVAIYVEHLANELMEIVNSGTIRGDFAIFASSLGFSPAQRGVETVTNQAGGLIDGAIYLDMGNDVIVNHGTIHGWIDMGEDNDLIDNRDGVIAGAANLGWGDDTYWGGAGVDAVTGDRGNDVIYGGAGDDLLLGGWGDDVLHGDAGNDGLYGEGGNDRIVTQGGDLVVAGDGDDIIELGDYSFASVSGGAGHDTLSLAPGDMRLLDFGLVAASNRVTGIDEIGLRSGQQIVLHAADVLAISDASMLVISAENLGTPSGTVDLAGSWTTGAGVTRGGVHYTSYTSGGATVLVEDGFTVTLGSTRVGIGLDGAAGGDPAPVAGQIAGAVLTPTHVLVNNFALTSSLTIERGEIWEAQNGNIVLSSEATDVAVINRGTITTTGGGTNGASAISAYNLTRIENYGLIEARADSGTASVAANLQYFATYGLHNLTGNMAGNVNGVYIGSSADVFRNEGEIRAGSSQTIAIGFQNWMMRDAVNAGTISATSSAFIATGVYAHNGGNFINTGTIEATGAQGAYGFGAGTFALTLNNSGTIRATSTDPAGADSIGVYLYYQSGTNHLTNSGLISADIAIQASWNVNGGAVYLDNSGRIEGRIELSVNPNGGPASADVIFNSGTIRDNVSMGGGNDIYDGSRGVQSGTIFGGDGNDYLVGGIGADRLDGGAGNDILIGGNGDVLTGGTGRDIFAFTGMAAGTSATITDFVSGTDKIDLSALNPTNVSISGSIVTVTSAQGVVTINADGTVAQSDIVLATASFTATVDNGSLLATAGGSTLIGSSGYDLLIGSTGNDRIDDGGNAANNSADRATDILIGGAGDDTYVIRGYNDLIYELAGQGYDTVEFYGTGTFTLPENIERFMGGSVIGNALDNMLIGGDGNDYLDGGTGTDMLVGLKGNDTYYVDGQEDLVFENPGEGTDTIISTASFYLYDNVENLTLQLGSNALYGVGNGLANVITGNDKDNLLLGGGGDDTLYGGSGNDWLYGEDGNDTLWGGEGTNYLIGGAGNDVLHGDVIDSLSQEGRGGQDFLYGGAGDDIYYVDDANDLTFEEVNGGTDTVYVNRTGGTYYLYANVENLVLTGKTLYGVGNELDNRITGSDAANWLLGGAGNDRIDGGKGNDVLYGEAGADTFVFGASSGIDTIGDFVPGTDKIDLSAYGFANFAAVQAAMTDQGGGIMNIALGGGNYIILIGVAKAQLNSGDFILSSSAQEAVKADVQAPATSISTSTKSAPVMAVDGGGKGVAAEHLWIDDQAGADTGLAALFQGGDAQGDDPIDYVGLHVIKSHWTDIDHFHLV